MTHFKTMMFLICGQLMRHPLIKLYHLSNLLQMPNDHRMVGIEFFGNFLCSCRRISFNAALIWSLSTSDGWTLHSSSSRLSFPLQNFLSHHCTVHSREVLGPNVLLVLRVVSAALQPILNTNFKKSLEFAFCLTLFLYSKIHIK